MTVKGYSVVVVGAGPAGSAIAARLAGAGHQVLLLDRARFPRPKPCGDCVSPAAVAELEELGVLEQVLAAPHARLRGWTIAAGEREGAFRGSFPTGLQGVAIARERLDALLLERAAASGAEVRTGVRVVDLLRETDGAVAGVVMAGGEVVRGRLVVGADGLRSVVVRRLGLLARPPRLRKIALIARLRGVGSAGDRGELRVIGGATVGIAPLGDGSVNVTVVVGEGEAARIAGARESFYDGIVGSLPDLSDGIRIGAVRATGPFDWPVRQAIADGALLVGDAAGYFDPFTGQGIYRALRGAALAASAAEDALAGGDLSAAALRPYELARRRAFGPGHRLQRVIEFFVARERLLRGAAALLRQRPGLADALVAVTGDLLPVRTLWSPRTLALLVAS